MNYRDAERELAKVGTRRAEGAALTAMYAKLLVDTHGGQAERYYEHLERQADVRRAAKRLLRDRAEAWAVLIDPAYQPAVEPELHQCATGNPGCLHDAAGNVVRQPGGDR